jgi:hypothetical protein
VRAWYLPAWHGDFRLIAGETDGTSKLLLMQPTPHEKQLIAKFMKIAKKKQWTRDRFDEDDAIDTQTIVLSAPVDKIGPALVKLTKPAASTLTAVSFKDGHLEVAGTGTLETLVAKAANDKEAKAVSVSRPTPCCPRCEVDSIAPARDVLLSFLTAQEHADWADHRAIMVRGGLSGHRYLLAHRHSKTAARLGKICYDVEDRCVLHFHDASVPPEEEVLAAKLILEHREPWLRNEATVLQQNSNGAWIDLGFMRYKNPFGDASDGRPDAVGTAMLGIAAQAALKVLKAAS